MFIRSELKEKAKLNIHKNIWLCIGVTLVFTLLSGGLFGVEFDAETNEAFFRMGLGNSGNISLDFIHLAIPTALAALVSLLSLAYAILVTNPLTIGHKRYYLDNKEEKSTFETLFYAFGKQGYWNIVKIVLLRDIYLVLWVLPSIGVLFFSILLYDPFLITGASVLAIFLLIPMIMKSYEYQMIPYILAENPTIDSQSAFRMTKEMTYGHKLDLFVLDLSFILWYLLGLITCGIGLFYVNVYTTATGVEAYLLLKEETYGQEIIEPEVTESEMKTEVSETEVEISENEPTESEETEYVEPTIDDLH